METTVQIIVKIDGKPQIYLYNGEIESMIINAIQCNTSVSKERISVEINTPPLTFDQLNK